MPALQNIQKHGKVLIAVVALALFAFIAEEGFRAMEQNSNANRNKVGEIDGEAISASDFEKLVDEYTEAMKFVQQRSSFTDEETTQIKDQVWQMLVNNKLVENECKKPEKEPVSYREADESGNYVINGDFAKEIGMDGSAAADKDNWKLYLESDAQATTYSIADNSITLAPSAVGSQNYSVQLKQENIPMYKGWEYELSFDAFAAENQNFRRV